MGYKEESEPFCIKMRKKSNSKRKAECPRKTIKAIQLTSNRTKQINYHVACTRKIKIKNLTILSVVMHEDPGMHIFKETFYQ